eukprot:CAMPEP_0168862498 /NCGR_PEP_ID=MMETSP0727-20121128/18471_1 /TAXON_ID=265536 /ORGANISM="Amphiprora sp., Strain CCMP467" /LENGTH=217 /DNA_ID=CAMNT_0008917549 /DNA_START=37 /DNA_END=690 /DNA_ORIENTATION=+
MLLPSLYYQRIVTAATTLRPLCGWGTIGTITGVTTVTAEVATGFVDPVQDFSPPVTQGWWRPWSALIVPGLVEEVIWRAAWLPIPPVIATVPDYPTTVSVALRQLTSVLRLLLANGTGTTTAAATAPSPQLVTLYQTALVVWVIHVVSHPMVATLADPRRRAVLDDWRFGGVVTHAVPVALWRDVWGGERRLRAATAPGEECHNDKNNDNSNNDNNQ